MHPRQWIALAAAFLGLLITSRAHAWQESHEAGDDVDVRVDPDGTASVRHLIRWHVVRGPLKSVDLANVDPAATLEPNVVVTTEDGRELGGHVARLAERDARITLDEPRALMRGTFVFDVRWRVDLVSSRALVRDGASWRLTLSAPVAADGFDAARTTLDLPAAPDEPRPILVDTGAVDDGAVATLRREGGRDRLELVRPHVARGEAVTWTTRIDPRALPVVVDPRLRSPAEGRAPPEPDRVREVSLASAVAGVGLAFGLLVWHKARAFGAICASAGGIARALVPLPVYARAMVAGGALAAGVALQVFGELLAGSALAAMAMVVAALRPPDARIAPRGPGRWLVFRPADAFADRRGVAFSSTTAPRRPDHWLDAGTRVGRVTALATAVFVVGIAAVARRFTMQGPGLVLLDAAVLAPLFCTGQSRQLPPDRVRSAAPWLARAFKRLRALESRTVGGEFIRVAPWVRVTLDGSAADELRLLVLPRAAAPGVVGIEVGLAWSSTPVGWVGTPEVLARVIEASAAATMLAQAAPHAAPGPGRRADERVIRLVPRAPTQKSTLALVRALAEAMTDRRVIVPAAAWTSAERRRVMGSPAAPQPA